MPRQHIPETIGTNLPTRFHEEPNFFSFKKGRRSNFRTRAGLRRFSTGQPDSRMQVEWDATMRRQVVQAADGPGDEAGEQGKP